MRKPVIGVDVDITLCESGNWWFDWLLNRVQSRPNFAKNLWRRDVENRIIGYDLSEYFTLKEGVCPFDFWRQRDLYDGMPIYISAKKVLKELYDKGWEIVFISYCFDTGAHAESKARMLKRELDFIKQEDFHFLQTKSKGVMSKSLDYMVDDRNEFLNQMEGNVHCFKINSPYTQDFSLTRECDEVQCWEEIGDYLRGEGL